MGEHKIGQLMKDMAVKSGLTAATGKKITNHSSRKAKECWYPEGQDY